MSWVECHANLLLSHFDGVAAEMELIINKKKEAAG